MTSGTQGFWGRVLDIRTPAEVKELLRSLGDSDDLSIGEAFGPLSLKWVPFGGNPSNISTVGLATKPGKSLGERITNAIDALLEERAQSSTVSLPQSPRDAAQTWFGRPVSGPETGLHQGISIPTDKRISVVLLGSSQEAAPTIDVLDEGVGLKPEDFSRTILSLQAGNKITKRYQIGAFGQGGSSTLGFSDYVFIASRHHEQREKVAFTIIRIIKLDATYKEDCYAYLTDAEGLPLVVEAGQEAILLYAKSDQLAPPSLAHGTLVRHYAYRLGNLSKQLGPSPGNLYHYFHYTIFDPILPFRVWDLRDPNGGRSEYVGGSRNRLMRLLKASEDSTGNVKLRHHRSMEYVVPSGSDVPCIGIEYWVVLAFKKQGDQEASLRGNSAELFVQPGHPIVGTLNGQTQGELTGSLLKEVGLGLLSRHMVVHIDASSADSKIRRQLFSTSREGFKDGPVLDSLTATLRRMLEEDSELAAIEKELTERLAKRDSASTREEVKQQVTRLLKEAGLQVSEVTRSDVGGGGDERSVSRQKRRIYVKPEPLETLPFSDVTFFNIVSPAESLKVSLQDSELVLIETDADTEFDRRGLIGVRSTEDLLEVESKTTLSGGRMRWRLRPAEKSKTGQSGELFVSLTRPNGQQLVSKIGFEILAAKERPSRSGKTVVPPFEIEPISPDQTEVWDMLWPDDGGDSSKQREHAYITSQISGKTWVYYSTDFPPYAEMLTRLKQSRPELVQAFTTAYEIWIAYHAILQKQLSESPAPDVGDDNMDQLLDQQRAVVASMQVKQAYQYADLWRKTLATAPEAGT